MNRLQDEKGELLREVEARRREALDSEDRVRDLIELLMEARPQRLNSPARKSNPLESLGRRIEDLVGAYRQTQEQNQSLTLAKEQAEALQREQGAELAVAIAENKRLHEQKKTLSRPV